MSLSNRAMIVEDEFIISMELQDRLQHLGYEVAGVASTTKQALNIFKNNHPNLVLMDLKLREGDSGIATASQIRLISNVPIIFISAHSDEDMLGNMNKITFSMYLHKPFTDSELKNTIKICHHYIFVNVLFNSFQKPSHSLQM